MAEVKQEKQMAMFCHISTFCGWVFPFGNLIAPLVIWLLKKEEMSFVNDQGKEVLNFQISITIYVFISVVLIFIAIGIPLLILIMIFNAVATIIGAIKAADGVNFRYPMTIRFL